MLYRSNPFVMQEVTIQCAQSTAALRFYSPQSEEESTQLKSFIAELTHDGLHAAVTVEHQQAGHVTHIAELFSEMAEEWRGWEGKKVGGSLEDEIFLSCTSDGLGHAFVEVKLQSGHYDTDWSAEATIRLDAQPLADTAKKLNRFFRTEHRAV